MFDVIHTIEPWVAGLAIAFWELFAGWCFWTSVRCERLESGRPTSDGDSGLVQRSRTGSGELPRSRTMRVLSTNA
jgi:hypothetical protein